MTARRRLDPSQVRRAHLAAQGMAEERPRADADIRHLRKVLRRVKVLQIDSVNVVERAHHLTVFSRLGGHDQDLLWRAFRRREVFEYWAHEACFVPVELYPLLKHRMEEFAATTPWRRARRLFEERPGYIESVYEEVRRRGPLTASDLDDPGERLGPWWGWSPGKVALEWLFGAGRVTVAERRNFTRYYDLIERVIPEGVLNRPVPDKADAYRALLLEAAAAVAVGTVRDLADYFRLDISLARRAAAELVQEGELDEVEVDGWRNPGLMRPRARIPRRVEARALVGPFDPVIWFRDRTERVYDFRYRIEVYVPRPDRIYGYYVFPFLLGDELVGRVDLKADRQQGALLVPGAFVEEGTEKGRVAAEMAIELREMAEWLGLDEIRVGRRGNLAAELRKRV
jgi:uncharacterized protein YcaQ